MKYVLPRDHLSASSISTLQKCPKQYEFRYIKGIINPPNAALVTGKVAHKTFETYYNDALTSAQRLTAKQAAELSGDTLEEYRKENEDAMSASEVDDTHKILSDIVYRYVDNVAQFIEPRATEREFKYVTQDGVPVLGYIDLLFNNGGEPAIADYKITSKKMSLGSLTDSLQFNVYALATGIGDIQIHNLVKAIGKPVARKTAQAQDGVTDYASNLRTIHHVFDGSQADHFEELIESAARLITSGIFMPCAPDSWCCNSNWCGYWHLCRGKHNI